MRTPMLKTVGLGLAASLLAIGCSSTSVKDAWKNPIAAQEPTPKKVLVVAVVPSESTRISLEQALATKLEEKGVVAIPSSSLIPSENLNEDAIKAAASGQQFDGVLVSRFAGLQEDVTYDPGYDYYFDGYGPSAGPSYSVSEQALMRTTLFGRNGQTRWTATTETFDPLAVSKRIPGLASALVKRMEKDQIIG